MCNGKKKTFFVHSFVCLFVWVFFIDAGLFVCYSSFINDLYIVLDLHNLKQISVNKYFVNLLSVGRQERRAVLA